MFLTWIKKKWYQLLSSKEANVYLDESKTYSLVLSSFNREENVKKILDQYLAYSSLSEIIVWHNGSNPFLYETGSQKLKLINSDDLGLATRYAAALLVKNEILFLQDDDLLVPEETLQYMANKHSEMNTTTTIEGKKPHSDGSYGVAVKPSMGEVEECEVHLNRCICTSKTLIPSFFSFWFKTQLSLTTLAGGGEDIVYSFAARLASGNRPVALGVKYQNLTDPSAISNRAGNQHRNRTKILHCCQNTYKELCEIT